MSVKQLAYIVFDIATEKLPAMHAIFEKLYQAPVVEGTDGSFKVRLDGRDFRLLFRAAASDRMAAVGWEVADAATLDQLVARVEAAGCPVNRASEAVCAQRSAREIATFTDPAGFPVELFIDQPFEQTTDDYGFVCGEDATGVFGLGHVVQACADLPGALSFYTDVLGFLESDEIDWKEVNADLRFLSCNTRHHSLALINEALGLKGGQIDHVMLQAKSFEQVERAYAALDDLGIVLSQTLGEHSNDNVRSFYFLTPAGFRMEFGFGGKTIEDRDSWQFEVYPGPSNWGHVPVNV